MVLMEMCGAEDSFLNRLADGPGTSAWDVGYEVLGGSTPWAVHISVHTVTALLWIVFSRILVE